MGNCATRPSVLAGPEGAAPKPLDKDQTLPPEDSSAVGNPLGDLLHEQKKAEQNEASDNKSIQPKAADTQEVQPKEVDTKLEETVKSADQKELKQDEAEKKETSVDAKADEAIPKENETPPVEAEVETTTEVEKREEK